MDTVFFLCQDLLAREVLHLRRTARAVMTTSSQPESWRAFHKDGTREPG